MRRSLALLALAALLLPGAAGFAFELPSIKNGLIELALDQISSPGSFEITAEAIEEPEKDVTSLLDVQVSDGEGVWLTLERINFAWDSGALLSGELSITRLELIGLTVTRPPSEDAEAPELKPAEPSERGIFDWPRAPLDLSVEGVRLERVSIAEGVLPQAIAFDAEGRAFDKGDLQELALSLKRTDTVAGEIALSMRRDFAANTVKLDITASEAPGGMVAAAAGFPPDAPARLELRADGPPEDWRLTFDAAVEQVFAAEGTANLAYAERLEIGADFSVVPGPDLSAEARTILGDRATLKARLIERENGMIEIVSGALASPALTLDASGAFATGAGDSDLAVKLVALPPLAALAEGVEFERFSFDGNVTGPQGGLRAEGKLGLSGLATAAADAGSLALDGRVAQTAGGMAFDLGGSGERLRIDKLGPDVIGAAKLVMAGELDGDLLTLARAALEAKALTVDVSGAYDLAAATGDLKARLAAPEIAPVAAAYGVAARGGVDASAEAALAGENIEATFSTGLTGFALDTVAADQLTLAGTVSQTGSQTGTQTGGVLAFDLSGDGKGLVLDQIPRDLTGALDLTARGAMQGGVLKLEILELASPLVTAGAFGSVALEDQRLALDYSLATADLTPVARAYGADAAGTLDAKGRAEGGFDALRLAGRVGLAGAGFDGIGYGAIDLSHDVALGASPEGSLSLTKQGGELGDGRVETRFRLAGSALTLEDVKAALLGASLSGRAEVDIDATLVDGAFDVAMRDLRPLGRLAGAPLSGAARGKVTLTAAETRQNAAADLTLTGFATDGAKLEQAKLRLSAADVTGTPGIDARINATGVDAEIVRLDALRAEAKGPLRAVRFSAGADGSLGKHPLTIVLDGTADASGAETAVSLAGAEVTAGPDTLRLRQPVALRIGGGSVTAKGIDLALPEDGSLTGDAALHPGGFAGDLTLSKLSLLLAQRWADVPVTAGQVDLTAQFDTRRGRAGAEVAARARGIAFDKIQAAAGGLDLDLDADWDGARLGTRTEVRGDFGDPVRASVTVPLRPGRGGVPQVPSNGEIDGSVVWAGDIGDLWALVPAAGHILDGNLDIDLKLGGSLAAPRLSGRADLNDGIYQNLDLGTILTDLTLGTTMDQAGALNVALAGTDGAKGKVEVSAALQLAGDEPVLDVTAGIDRATLVRRDDLSALLSGDVAVSGPVSDLAVKARLTIDKAELRLVNATPPSVVDLEGIRIKGTPEPEGNGNGGQSVSLDVTVQAARDIFVRGRGLESEWKMDLTVTGDAAQPKVAGVIERVRGTLDLLGRPFDLARGKVTFDGGRVIDPLIDILLELEDHGIRGGIQVEGRSSNPELRFVSQPALPEDEVLPRLLFGRSRQSLSGSEAIQLGAGIATLLSGQSGPLDAVREAAGVDVLRVDGTGTDDASVTVGRNVAEGVFIGARQGLGDKGSAVSVEVEVFDGVTVDSEVQQEGGSNVGITLRKDF